MGRLDGKTCLVSAAGQGIGRASVLAMIAEGARVFATDINQSSLSDLEKHGACVFGLDVTEQDSIAAAVDKIGSLDVLFNCAGFVDSGTILECDEDQWQFSNSLNVTAMYRMIRAFLPGMLANGGSSIINMSSAVSSVIAAQNRFVYGTTKAAVIGMTKSIAVDFVQQGIRCNAICPGTVESPSLEQRLHDSGDYQAAKVAFINRQPMGRIGKASEIAALVVYLASDDAAYTTGVAHIIDGGWTNS